MNTGFFRKDKIYKDVGGVTTQIFDFASQPNITPAQLALATGMSLLRATELVAERTTFDSTQCVLSTISNINFVSATYSVVEPDSGVSVVNVVLRRTNGCDGSITVTIDRVAGTATAGTDYINIFPLTQTWLDGDCSDKTVQVSIMGDVANEPGIAETLVLGISNPIGNGIIGSLNQTTISITDNDLVYIVNTQISNTSNCLPTGLTTYPISANVLGGTNYNVPINLNGCNLTAILVNGVNVTALELSNAKSTGIHPLLNVQNNITVELVYSTPTPICPNSLIYDETWNKDINNNPTFANRFPMPCVVSKIEPYVFINTIIGNSFQLAMPLTIQLVSTNVGTNGFGFTAFSNSYYAFVGAGTSLDGSEQAGNWSYTVRITDANGCSYLKTTNYTLT